MQHQSGKFKDRVHPHGVDFRRLVEGSLDIFCTASPQGYFLYVNSAFENLLGYPAGELCSRPLLEFVHPDDREQTRQVIVKLLSGAKVGPVENRYQCADGTYRWLNWRAVGLGTGGVISATAADITQQKQLIADLERLALVAAATNNAVVVTDALGRIEWVNEGFVKMTGYSMAEVVGKRPGSFLQGPETNLDTKARVREAVRNGQGLQFEILNYHRTGYTYWLDVEIQPIRNAQGVLTHFMAIELDITARKKDEQKLRDTLQLLARLSASSKIGAWEIDMATTQPVWSEEVYRIHEVDLADRHSLETAIDFYEGPARATISAAVSRAIKSGERWDLELPLITAKGRRIWVRSVGEARFENGRCAVLNGTFQDVTLDRQKSQRLRHSELRHRTLIAAMPDAFLSFDADGHLLDLQCPPSFPLLTVDAARRVLRPELETAIGGILESGSHTTHAECVLPSPEGAHHLELRVAPLEERGGNLVLIRDITQRKAVEEELASSRAWKTALLDFAGFSVIAVSLDGTIRLFNRAAEDMLGYRSEEVRDRLTPMIFHLPEEIAARAQQYSLELGFPVEPGLDTFTLKAKLNLPNECEWTYIRRDGSRLPVLLPVTAARNSMGEITGFLGVALDITARREANRQVEAARQAAESASRAKSDFLANMSHEIRTPMNAIIGFANLLAGTPLARDQHEFLETIRGSSSALLELINDLLDFSKIEAGKLKLESIPCDAFQIASDVCTLFAPRLADSPVELVLDWSEEAPRKLMGDPVRIRQVLLNLVGNAAKFTRAGSIVVRAVQPDGGLLRIEVTDTGIGIDPAVRPLLFGKFMQADTSTTRKFGGTGLGLAISRQLTEAMGGQIGVESTLGEGSTFWFNLPVTAAITPVQQDLVSGGPLRVLIVDDLPINRRLLETHCDHWGFLHRSAASAEEGLAMLRDAVACQQPYAVAVLDCMMPVIDGVQMGRFILADDELRATALLMLTSRGNHGEQGDTVGFAGVLSKPLLRPDLLREAILHAAGRPTTAQAPTPPPESVPMLLDHPEEENPPRVRVLLAEDNPTNQRLAKILLKKLGCQVDLANDGEQAVTLALANSYDVIFMDCQMPGMDGFEATEAIRNVRLSPPIVALTANAMIGDRQRCLDVGMDDYLTKPVSLNELARAVKQWAKPVLAVDGFRM